MADARKVFVVKKTTGRDIAIGAVAGALVLGFILYGIFHMSQGNGGMLTGKIVAKHFKPQPEEQVSIGKAGLYAQNIDGEYTMEVAVPGDRTYTVWVEKPVYEAHKVGDDLTFMPPPAKGP